MSTAACTCPDGLAASRRRPDFGSIQAKSAFVSKNNHSQTFRTLSAGGTAWGVPLQYRARAAPGRYARLLNVRRTIP